jgi:transcriptional repressor NrdR
MKCPFCSHPDTQVVETREAEDGGFIRRRRQCGGCDKRFTTYGRRIEYERAKLLGSFKIALRKRPVSTEQIDAAIERIEERLRSLGEREVLSSRLGEMVMRELKLLDKVGYIRFASVYRSFEDVDDFKNVMDEVRNPG